jgi:hypothetical protein
MAIEVILHIQNSDPVLGEIDELPDSKDTILRVSNPRQRDGKDLIFLNSNVVTVYWPIQQITFLEILPSGEDEQIVGFVRE